MCPCHVCFCHAMLQSRFGSRVYPTITTEGHFILVKKKKKNPVHGHRLQAPTFPSVSPWNTFLTKKNHNQIIHLSRNEWAGGPQKQLALFPWMDAEWQGDQCPSASLTFNELKLESSGSRAMGLCLLVPYFLLSHVEGPVKACLVGFHRLVYFLELQGWSMWSGLVE